MSKKKKYHLLDLIDEKALHHYKETFSGSTGVNIFISDNSGKIIGEAPPSLPSSAVHKATVPLVLEDVHLADWHIAHENEDLLKSTQKLLEASVKVFVSLCIQYIDLRERLTRCEKDKVSLKMREAKFRKVFEKLPDTYIKTNKSGRIKLISPSVEILLGYKPGEIQDKNIADFLDNPGMWKNIVNEMEEFWVVENLELVLSGKDGVKVWSSLSTNFIYDKNGNITGIEGIFKDITELKYMMDQLENARKKAEELSNTDYLTGLYNRRYFFDVGKKLYENARRSNKLLTVCMLDIDFFKRVNDSFGHEAGDAVLKKIASLLSHNLRDADVVARFGGEEFCILAINMGKDVAGGTFERIRGLVEQESVTYKKKKINVTASFGVATCWQESLEAVVNRSDQLLYKAKQSGRNCVVVE